MCIFGWVFYKWYLNVTNCKYPAHKSYWALNSTEYAEIIIQICWFLFSRSLSSTYFWPCNEISFSRNIIMDYCPQSKGSTHSCGNKLRIILTILWIHKIPKITSFLYSPLKWPLPLLLSMKTACWQSDETAHTHLVAQTNAGIMWKYYWNKVDLWKWPNRLFILVIDQQTWLERWVENSIFNTICGSRGAKVKSGHCQQIFFYINQI